MEGKSLIVYYSWVGNTEVVAKVIQRLTGFDIHRIQEKKNREAGHIAGGAMGAFLGLKSKIKPMDFTLSAYNNIFLGVQVWAGKTTPAVNRYLSKVCLKDKKVWLFITLPYIIKLLLILIFKGPKSLRFTVTDGCIGCYRCIKICPVNNIGWVNGRPVFGNDCMSCFACLQWCPESAIRIGKYSFDAIGMKHYHHPGVKPEDLFMDTTRE